VREAYVLTLKGSDWLNSYFDEDFCSPNENLFEALADIQEGTPVDTQYYNKSLNYALSKGLITKDTRSIRQVLSDISRYDRDLGKILRVYHDIGLQKQVRDEDLQEALFNALDRVSDTSRMEPDDKASKSLLRALKSQSNSIKIEALDTWVSKLHREGLLWNWHKNVPARVSADVATVLDRFRDY